MIIFTSKMNSTVKIRVGRDQSEFQYLVVFDLKIYDFVSNFCSLYTFPTVVIPFQGNSQAQNSNLKRSIQKNFFNPSNQDSEWPKTRFWHKKCDYYWAHECAKPIFRHKLRQDQTKPTYKYKTYRDLSSMVLNFISKSKFSKGFLKNTILL